jgi:hypothetical protein
MRAVRNDFIGRASGTGENGKIVRGRHGQ